MLEIIDIGFEKAVAYRLEGKITEEEMLSVLSIFKEKIDKGEKLIVYQEVVSIGGVEFDAMIDKFKFFMDVGMSHFSRIAVVTHKKWIHKLVDLEDRLFKDISIKAFPIEKKNKAIEFLKTA
jgi:hypothetical protein